jgi:acyl-CoA synthetase (AMP-forming)/AMP-acid ligase II
MVDFCKRAFRVILTTEVLKPHPGWSVILFLYSYVRYRNTLLTLAFWTSLRFPERIAVADDNVSVTYKELMRRVPKLAWTLEQTFQLQPNQQVGIWCKNQVSLVEMILACEMLELHAVLLHDLAQPELGNCDLLLCDPEIKLRYETILYYAKPILYTHSQSPCFEDLINQPVHFRKRLGHSMGRVVLLTSGTTGQPKRVERRLGFWFSLNNIIGMLERLNFKAGEATFLATPLVHGQGLATLAFCFAMGAPLYLYRFKPEKLVNQLEQQHIRHVVLVPTLLYRWLFAVQHHPGKIKSILCGSAPLGSELATQALQQFGPVLYNLYGSTETGMISIATPQDLIQAPDSVGQILPNVCINISELGEIAINMPIKRVTKTGDIGYIAQGRLFLQGRKDDMMICGGQNVYPEMLENLTKERLAYVADCAVVGIPSSDYGQALHYYIVLKKDCHDFPYENIIQDLRAQLPKTFRPSKLTLKSQLPRNHLGKLLRHQLQNTQTELHA